MKTHYSTSEEPSSSFCCCWLALVLTLALPLAAGSFAVPLVPLAVRLVPFCLSCCPWSSSCSLARRFLYIFGARVCCFWNFVFIFWCVCVFVWTFSSWFIPNWGQLWYVYSFSNLCVTMPIYEHKRAVLCTIPAMALTPAPTLAGILDDLESQMGAETMKTQVCNIMQHGNKAFLIHLASPEQVPEFVAHGYTFRGHQLHAAPVKSTTIVVLDRVPYGLPKEAVTNVVAKYGTISGYKAITHKGYSMSKFRLEVDLRQDIPSRINVQGNPINVFYKNQPRLCFVCREAGHEAKNCPRKAGPARPSNQPAGQFSFAAVTAGAKTPVAPSHTNEVLADPPATKESGQLPEVEPLSMAVDESVAEPKTIQPSEANLQPELPAPPAQSTMESGPLSDQMVVPPAGGENACLLSAVESQESEQSVNVDTQPSPVLDDAKSSSTEVLSTQQLFQQFENTPPPRIPRPSDLSEMSDSSPSAAEGRKPSLQNKRAKVHHPKPTYKADTTIHGSGRQKTRPIMATSGSKKIPTANRFTLLETQDEEH